MKKVVLIATVVLAVAAVASCGGSRTKMADMEAKLDSIRKAESLQQMKRDAGIYDDPVEQFFDTLQLRTLPIRSAGDNLALLAHFTRVPHSVAAQLGYPVETPLRMAALPRAHGYFVGLLAEGSDSVPPVISLVVLDGQYQMLDELCIYEQKDEERGDDRGQVVNDYYITSDYEITVLTSFRKQGDRRLPHVEQSRRYVIARDGSFQETIIDIE